jgi:hypothetical protein
LKEAKINVLKNKIKYWNRVSSNDVDLYKELEFVKSKMNPELYRGISIAIGHLGNVGDLANDVTANADVTISN